jgi:S-methyl-1-thioxylulose 5-phosphate methylthiotransferase
MHGARIPFDQATFRWVGIEPQPYKPRTETEPGMGFRGIARHRLADPESLPAHFELRYFELEPGGYSSLEKHEHAHFVIALRGAGLALVGSEMHELTPLDALHVPPLAPHRWLNPGDEPFGFLCPADASRDQPQPLEQHEWDALRADPRTAQFLF